MSDRSLGDVLTALSKCRRAELVITGPTKADSGVTTIHRAEGVTRRPWSISERPAHARITLRGEFIWRGRQVHSAKVQFRQRHHETIEALIWRALSEFKKREIEGNPKPKPRDVRRRQLRKLMDRPTSGRPN